jgi:hypothetical protein
MLRTADAVIRFLAFFILAEKITQVFTVIRAIWALEAFTGTVLDTALLIVCLIRASSFSTKQFIRILLTDIVFWTHMRAALAFCLAACFCIIWCYALPTTAYQFVFRWSFSVAAWTCEGMACFVLDTAVFDILF